MYCYQCQEAAGGVACKSQKGVCGKPADVADLQDLLIYALKGIAQAVERGATRDEEVDTFVITGIFKTITNANFDGAVFEKDIAQALEIRDSLIQSAGISADTDALSFHLKGNLLDAVLRKNKMVEKASEVGVLATENEDVRSLRELLTYGVKGIAAYYEHAANLGKKDTEITDFIYKALAATLDDTLSADDLTNLVLECGKFGVNVMALLDAANTEAYGNPEITEVNIGVRNNPAILISGHDLKDMERLLEQTKGTGVDVYTHSEMLPANYYPTFKKYDHFVGNYGNAWWKQNEEFKSFNGPVLFTTNCITPPAKEYKDRIYTTGAAGFDGCTHIAADAAGNKDFSALIAHAKECEPPKEIEKGTITGGFAHNQVLALADKVVDAVKGGAIKKFVVMAGCDGRMKSRDYYTDFAKALPQDTVILTAGCAKYRYNKLDLGDIGGIPRVLDAGQCNDSYSLAVIAMKLQEVFGLEDINDLPIVYNIAWYEQKAVIVLLALLSLGVKNIHLGPTLPAFLSPNVANILVETFGIGGVGEVEQDIKEMITA
ncbi:hydroxylamine reductase [Chitinivibrio alkaliphilus]|uniref:Hydroxylamine reductase n=1 Tax=Chitinivibrio alkaliphilus ACht1 TaxID=1313304 RepID=U7D7Q1_9BACT|nr:hydroxylamine reductase [Chitinivibrio alkaliphilus]ERP31122.1 hybrid cluster protein [Chitinivibrio alkaliphilus ACht1]